MKNTSRRGFTIIEVMLFLAITGLMIAGILAGVGDNIRNQNYREGVNELRSVVQGQFDKVYSLTSDRSGLSDDPCVSGEPSRRGMSSCLYVGRMLHFIPPEDGGGSLVQVRPVVAELKVDESNRFTDVFATQEQALTAYRLDDYRISVWNGDDSFHEDYKFNWQLTGYTPNGEGYSDTQRTSDSLLILRSPVDGGVRAYKIPSRGSIYAENSSSRDLMEDDALNPGVSVLDNPEADDEIIMCLVDTSMPVAPNVLMSVRIAGSATGPGDIEVLSNNLLEERGMPTC